MSKFPPTAEQRQAIDAFTSRRGNLVLEAAAGTGKTTTLKMLTDSSPRTRFLYLAYNRAVADDARATFGANVTAVTAHGWAMRNLRGSNDPQVTAVLERLQAARQSNSKVATHLGIRQAFKVDDGVFLQPNTLARLAKQTVTNWCYSADEEISSKHVEIPVGVVDDAAQAELRRLVLPWARKVWTDATNSNGTMRTEHDHYLKLFAMRQTRWAGVDTVLLDEAQDSNAVVCNMVGDQIGFGARTVVVGDRYQSLYAWRGAVDAMSMFPADQVVRLTQSFRFGPAVAEEANKWLTALGSDMQVTGTPSLNTQVVPFMAQPDAVLCRTNAEAMAKLMEGIRARKRVAVVGGGREVKRMAESALELQTRGSTNHPDLCAFTSWGAVQDFVDDGGGDLKSFVNLIDTYTADGVIEAVEAASDEASADLVVSTAHKSKGREWHKVRIADDFPSPGADETPDRAEMMLGYVAVTRAKTQLDRGSLDWIDDYATEAARPRVPLAEIPPAPTGAAEPAGEATAPVEPPVEPGADPAGHTSGADQAPATDSDQPALFGQGALETRQVSLTLSRDDWAFLEMWGSYEGSEPADVIGQALALLVETAEEDAGRSEKGTPWFAQ